MLLCNRDYLRPGSGENHAQSDAVGAEKPIHEIELYRLPVNCILGGVQSIPRPDSSTPALHADDGLFYPQNHEESDDAVGYVIGSTFAYSQAFTMAGRDSL
jgi:hypothetical protein